MKYFKNTATDEVFGYDETDETQIPYMQQAIDSGFVDVSDVWPPVKIKTQNDLLLEQIVALEATMTPRRIREAVKDPAWLNALDAEIAALRAQLIRSE